MNHDATFEVRKVERVSGNQLIFDEPLGSRHARGEIVSKEFVRYRWYPDVQFGTAYFHDHVNAVASWKHGLFGALIAEPPGSSYHDPHAGGVLRSGPVADIHTRERVSTDVTGSFREMVMFIQDDNPLNSIGRSSGSAFNLRAEPLDLRKGDHSLLFSSNEHGDPATPVLEAYLGDPMVIRTLVGATNDVHTWHLDGHWFRAEPYSASSPPLNTIHIGISERYDLAIPNAGGPQALPGDYLYYNGRSFKLREGSWGILRVREGSDSIGPNKLPGHETTPSPARFLCPTGAPQKNFAVAAIETPLPMLQNAPGTPQGKIYVLQTDKAAVLSGKRPPEPLVLHVNVGDCVTVVLTNETKEGSVSFHADMLAFDPKVSGGIAAGRDPPQAVAPGQDRTFTYFASPEVGETAALIRDWGDVLKNPGLGLYGAIIVGPSGARYLDPANGQDASAASAWKVNVIPAHGPAYRDFSLFFQDEDAGIGTHRMPYTEQVQGVVGLNYRLAPLADRRTKSPGSSKVFDSKVHGDPATPLIEAHLGDPVWVHVFAPWSEQAQVFSIEGHRWPFEPGRSGTNMLASVLVGGLEATTIILEGGAGGPGGLPGDYLYGDHREPYREAGLWGIFRVSCPGGNLRPLNPAAHAQSEACGGATSRGLVAPTVAAVLALLLLAGALRVHRRRNATSQGVESS